MRCPYCSVEVYPSWQPLVTFVSEFGTPSHRPNMALYTQGDREVLTYLQWMGCPNPDCARLVVKIIRARTSTVFESREGAEPPEPDEEWLVFPRSASRPVDKLVPDDLKEEYVEASRIIYDSPRMSAALSRDILSELLKRYAGLPEKNLQDQIDKFNKDLAHPESMRKVLHVLRELGNFGVHTQRDDQGQRIPITKDEADFALTVIERLFDYLIISPARDAEALAQMQAKIKQAGRKPLP